MLTTLATMFPVFTPTKEHQQLRSTSNQGAPERHAGTPLLWPALFYPISHGKASLGSAFAGACTFSLRWYSDKGLGRGSGDYLGNDKPPITWGCTWTHISWHICSLDGGVIIPCRHGCSSTSILYLARASEWAVCAFQSAEGQSHVKGTAQKSL